MTNDLERLTPRLKSLQRNMLQPETGQHMEYAGKITQKMQVTEIKATLYAYLAGGGSMVKVFA